MINNNHVWIDKDSEKEEYTYTLTREGSSSAERPPEERYVERSFWIGTLKALTSSVFDVNEIGVHAWFPLTNRRYAAPG